MGIQIGLINKYFAMVGDKLSVDHYKKLDVKVSSCIQCSYCNECCPFKVNQRQRMDEIKDYFNE